MKRYRVTIYTKSQDCMPSFSVDEESKQDFLNLMKECEFRDFIKIEDVTSDSEFHIRFCEIVGIEIREIP